MALVIGKDSLARLQSSARAILVHESLLPLLPRSARLFDLVCFVGDHLGSKMEQDVPLSTSTVPMSISLIVDVGGGSTGRQVLAALEAAGVPLLPKLIKIGRLQTLTHWGRARITSAFSDVLADTLGSDSYSALENSRQILRLREQNEQYRAEIDRMKLMLGAVGFRGEIVIEDLQTTGLKPLALPVSHGFARNLRSLDRISLYETSTTPSLISLEFTNGARETHRIEVETHGRRGWLSVDIPHNLVATAQDGEVTITALRGTPTFAGRDEKVAMRFWWDAPPADESSTTRHLQLPEPVSLSRRNDTPTVLRGLWLEQGSIVTLSATAAVTAPVGLALVSHGSRQTQAPSNFRSNNAPGDVAQPTSEPANVAGRYDVILLENAGARGSQTLEWTSATAAPISSAKAASFATARFASLHSAISFADGQVEELALNASVGYPVVAASDGQPYLQTHPVEERIVGALVGNIVPVGSTRMWLDIENAHPLADTIEFIVLLTKEVVSGNIENWVLSKNLPHYDGLHIADLPNNELVCRVVMKPGTARTIDLQLPAALPFQGQLYCLVNCRGASNRYGWCRWYSVVFAIDQETPLPLDS